MTTDQPMTEDMDLVRAYASRSSEEAFATLVSRHINLVYSVALRQLRDAHLAEEVTQAAFIILARKAGSLGPKTILSAWLCRTAQYAAADLLRTQRRRQSREQEVYVQSLVNQPEPDSSPWTDIAPLLDIALARLGAKDHNAIVLRYFEGKDLKQVGAALGVSENTAKTRVSRAVEKLRKFFVSRGITLPADAITGAIAANSVQVAPVALAKSVTAVAIAKGAAASGSTLTLVRGALKIMAWTKAKILIGVGIAAFLTVGTTSIVFLKNPAPFVDLALFSRTKELTSDVEAQYASYAGSTPEQAARTFFEACGREDWVEVAKFWEPGTRFPLDDKVKNYLGGLQIISLGTPFSAWVRGGGKVGGAFVPYKIRFKNGGVKRFHLQVRCDNPEKRWYVDGGL
ncbi:MAG: sigma-70 family RNA polymerase sigma factor [Verrucomicrobiae bacterium]|nr:sigma-70 family RNA polymerase sigma factor [Verrucomicrobiae bacterium]